MSELSSKKFLDTCRTFLAANQIVELGGDSDFELNAYLTDERGVFSGEAICLLYPKTTLEIQSIVRNAEETETSLIAVGGNTGLCGGATPPPTENKSGTRAKRQTALCSLAKMNSILEVDRDASKITVEAGATIEEVITAAEKSGLYFPLRFGAQSSAQVGGAIATNAGGHSALRYGNMADLLLGVEAVMADGSIVNQLKGLTKDNTGYDIMRLLCGSEGTLGIITTAVLELFPAPSDIEQALISIVDLSSATEVLNLFKEQSDGKVSAFEWMSPRAIKTACLVEGVVNPFETDAGGQGFDLGLVLVELASSSQETDLEKVMLRTLQMASSQNLISDALVANSKAQSEAFWKLRESIPQGEKLAGGSIKHDVSVPVSSVAEFISRMEVTLKNSGFLICAYGHLGDGNIHYNLLSGDMDVKTSLEEGEKLTTMIFDIVEELGGSFSAEHGIGQLRLGELEKRGDPGTLLVMKKIKSALDPKNILNPGKVILPDV